MPVFSCLGAEQWLICCLVAVSSYLMAVFYVFCLVAVSSCLLGDGKKRVGNKKEECLCLVPVFVVWWLFLCLLPGG